MAPITRRTLVRHVGATTLLFGSCGVAGAGGTETADELDVSFTVTGRTDAGVDHRASITCGSVVEASGRIVCASTCETARLAGVELHHGTLRIAVETVTDEADDCDQEPTGIEYEVAVTGFDHPPENVTLLHDGAVTARERCDGDDSGDDTSADPGERSFSGKDRSAPDFSFADDEFEFGFPEDSDHDPLAFSFAEREQPEFSFAEREQPEFSFEERDAPTFSFDEREQPEFSFGESDE